MKTWLGRCLGISCVYLLIGCVVAGTFEAATRADLKFKRRQQRAAQFLQKATFGPTEEAIDDLAQRMMQIGVRRACDEWIEHQFALPPTLHQPTIDAMLADHGITNTDENTYLFRYRYHAVYHNAIRAEDQLRQRVAWALSQIFVVSDLDGTFGETALNHDGIPHWYGPTNFYDKFVTGASGSYRDILADVSFHPVMGTYLSHIRNAKADPESNYFPDENYAREVMQLFSIGLYELHMDGRSQVDDEGNLVPTYDNETIKSMARVFTGLTFNRSRDFYWSETRDFIEPMEMWDEYHDTEAKELLRGTVVPAHEGRPGDGIQDVQAALDNLAEHPNVGPFLARRLIQLLVHSNPSRGYIRRVANVFNGTQTGVRGDMKAVIRAILLDREAWVGVRGRTLKEPYRLEFRVRGSAYSKLQEPMLRYLAVIRALQKDAFYDDQPSDWYIVGRTQWEIGQSPFGAPNVFNFYLPNYQPSGALSDAVPSKRNPHGRYFAPEFMLLTPVMNNRMANHFRHLIYNEEARFGHWGPNDNPHSSRITFDYSSMLDQVENDPNTLMDRLDLLFCAGTLADETRNKILQSVAEVDAEYSGIPPEEKLWAVLNSVICSPSCVVIE